MGEFSYPSTVARRTEVQRDGAAATLPEAKKSERPASGAAGGRPVLTRRGQRLVASLERLFPWLIPLATIVAGLRMLDVPDDMIATYGAYFLLCVILPGMLLLRALWRSTGNWAEDIGLGAAVGLTYEIGGWAIFTSLGLQEYLVVWPALVVVLFLVVPPLRRRGWRIADPKPLPVTWTWLVALGVTVSVIFGIYLGLDTSAVPPDGTAYYQDMLYHLSLVNEAIRSVPPELPQVSGNRLDYHWFANAHMAAASDITGAPTTMVLFRLWILPMHVASLLIFAALARQVSRVWWAGVMAVALLCSAQYIDVWAFPAAIGIGTMSFYSPSLVYGVVVGTAVAVLLIDQLYRGPAPRRTWILTVGLLIVGGGAKPTTVPLLLGGTGLAALFLLISKRRIPWRSLFTGVLLVVLAAVTLVAVVGSTAGSAFRLLGFLRLAPNYIAATGDESMPSGGGWTLLSLTDGDNVAMWGALVLAATLFVAQLCTFSSFGLLGHRGTRKDPVAWWLVGCVIAGWLGLLLVDHPSGGEAYFPRSAMPFAAAGTAWLLTSALRGRARRTRVLVVLTGLALGAGLVVIAARVKPSRLGSRENMIGALGWPMAVLVGSALVAMVVWFLLRRFVRPRLKGLGAAVAALALFGMTLPSTYAYSDHIVNSGLPRVTPARGTGNQVHPDEQRAAFWLRENSAEDDVVASNTACWPARRQPPCDARGYIVSGIAGRRTLLEGWAYTQQALAMQGVNGLTYHFQPSPWQDRAAAIRQLFSEPTPQLIETLRIAYGVRWVYADLLAGPVATQKLGELAVLRHEEPSVLVYELPDIVMPTSSDLPPRGQSEVTPRRSTGSPTPWAGQGAGQGAG